VTLWGLRLSLYILWRNWGKPEDYRYRRWRRDHGRWWWWVSLFQVFLLQGVLMWVISAPLLAAQRGPVQRLTALDLLAALLWAAGFTLEAVGDYQMARFRSDPANRGRVLDRGLWRYTRHPNYFGDAVQWWAYWLFAAAAGGFWTVWSPIVMTWLLLRVSGVAMLERTLVETKPRYREYVASTPAFVPWFPKGRE
jgi:steroid 5-alpha reductase family enzyme